MDLPIRDILPRLYGHFHRLPVTKTPTARQSRYSHALNPSTQTLLPVRAQRLHTLAFRPTIHRPLKVLLHHILETRFLEIPRIVPAPRPAHAQLRRGFDDRLLPVVEICAFQRVVDSTHRDHDVLELEVAAGLEGVEGGLDDGKGVFEAGYKHAPVDEVEFSAVIPFVFGVVDFEAAVWWDARVC